MIAVPAMFRNGMTPVMFMNRIMKNIVVRIGRNRSPSFLPSRSCAMLVRTKPRPISTRLWNRPGTIVILRVPSQKTSTTAMVARIWIRWIRVIGTPETVDEDRAGKNSSIDGAWNSPPSSAVRGDQCRSVSEQRGLQLRGTEDQPLRRWSVSVIRRACAMERTGGREIQPYQTRERS